MSMGTKPGYVGEFVLPGHVQGKGNWTSHGDITVGYQDRFALREVLPGTGPRVTHIVSEDDTVTMHVVSGAGTAKPASVTLSSPGQGTKSSPVLNLKGAFHTFNLTRDALRDDFVISADSPVDGSNYGATPLGSVIKSGAPTGGAIQNGEFGLTPLVTNVAKNKAVSTNLANTAARLTSIVTDGNPAGSDYQSGSATGTMTVMLGTRHYISRVKLSWGTWKANDFAIQLKDGTSAPVTVYETTTAPEVPSRIDDLAIPAGYATEVILLCRGRKDAGYHINEIEAHGYDAIVSVNGPNRIHTEFFSISSSTGSDSAVNGFTRFRGHTQMKSNAHINRLTVGRNAAGQWGEGHQDLSVVSSDAVARLEIKSGGTNDANIRVTAAANKKATLSLGDGYWWNNTIRTTATSSTFTPQNYTGFHTFNFIFDGSYAAPADPTWESAWQLHSAGHECTEAVVGSNIMATFEQCKAHCAGNAFMDYKARDSSTDGTHYCICSDACTLSAPYPAYDVYRCTLASCPAPTPGGYLQLNSDATKTTGLGVGAASMGVEPRATDLWTIQRATGNTRMRGHLLVGQSSTFLTDAFNGDTAMSGNLTVGGNAGGHASTGPKTASIKSLNSTASVVVQSGMSKTTGTADATLLLQTPAGANGVVVLQKGQDVFRYEIVILIEIVIIRIKLC